MTPGVARAPAAAARAHEELFGYWASLRRGAKLPARRHLDPREIKRLLPTVSLIDVGPTVLDLFGVDTPGTYMGESLVPALVGQPLSLTRPKS